MERDIQLDMYRGMAMIYIVCWIHVLYWLGITIPFKGYFLIEMPVIFFIAGASAKLSRQRKEKEVIRNRFKRVFVPYYKYLFLALVAYGGYKFFRCHILFIDNWKQAVGLLLGFNMFPNVPFIWSHTWFILPYFIISIFPKKINLKWEGRITIIDFLLIIVLDVIAYYLPIINVIRVCTLAREILVYNLFYLAGFMFYKNISKKGICYIFILGAIFFLCVRPFYSHDLQVDKFPPNLYFLAFNICAMSLLGLIFSYVRLPKIKIISLWNTSGYGIYIYQPLYFCLWMLMNIFLNNFFNIKLPLLAYFMSAICFMFLSGSCFGKIISNKTIKKILA